MECTNFGCPQEDGCFWEKKLRIVMDFRKLNYLMIGDSFPLPNITDILNQVDNAKYFSILDLASDYHQIPMHKDHRNKTAFSIPYGHYEFYRMPKNYRTLTQLFFDPHKRKIQKDK